MVKAAQVNAGPGSQAAKSTRADKEKAPAHRLSQAWCPTLLEIQTVMAIPDELNPSDAQREENYPKGFSAIGVKGGLLKKQNKAVVLDLHVSFTKLQLQSFHP